MRVLFVYTVSESPRPPRKPILEWIEISFSVSYLSAALKRAGHDVSLVVLRHGRFKQEVASALANADPALVCYTAVATEYPYVEKIARYVAKIRPGVYQAIGGTHPTLQPEAVIEGPFDAVCVGEGEAAIVELADALALGERPKGIGGFWLRADGSVERNPARDFEQDLDGLPIPDREIWRPWIEEPFKHTVLIARGCPFPCTYCSNHALSQVADGKFVRFRSVESVVEELRALCAEFPEANYCYFEVETITANREWALEFAHQLEEFNAARPEPMRFATNFRVLPRKRFPEFFQALRRAGFWYLRIGIESGSERIRQEVLKRYESNADLLATFEDAQAAGLEVFAYNLIGIPGETPADFMETVALNQASVVTRSYISIFYPYPGTELERVCAERGIVVPPLVDSAERFRARLGLPEFSDRLVERNFRDFAHLVSGEKAGPLARLDAYVWQTLRGHPSLARVAKRLTGHGVGRRLKRATSWVTALFAPRR